MSFVHAILFLVKGSSEASWDFFLQYPAAELNVVPLVRIVRVLRVVRGQYGPDYSPDRSDYSPETPGSGQLYTTLARDADVTPALLR